MTKMLKLLFVFSFIAITSSAEAKVCFLPGVLSGDGCMNSAAYENNPCPGFSRTTPCLSGYSQETCVKGSQTLYKCTCQSGNFTRDNGLETTYTCTKSYDSACGCSPQDTKCNSHIFKLAQEDGYCTAKFLGSEPSETCTNPSDGKIFYKDCQCSSSVYPYTCKENGLKAPSGTNSCTDRSGNKHYSRCDCADNWQSNPCNERTDGCTAVGKRVLRGDNEYCYSCTAEKCAKAGEINLDNYWCAMPQGSQTDCAKLGYTYVQSGKCPDGSIGIRCPYNKQYMYCLSICNTAADTNCAEWSGTGKDCTCATCKSGYELKNGQCNKKACPTIKVRYPIYGNSSGSAAFTYKNVQATTNSSEAACGTQASKGWSTVLTGSYSGDDACWVCKPKFCPVGYSTDKTSIADCGDSSLWSFQLANTTAGDDLCGKCTRKTTTCPSGYTSGLTNASKCGSSGAKGWTVQTQGVCGKCVAKNCVAGMSENTSGVKVDGVPLGNYTKSYYFDFSPNDYYTGDARCGTFTLIPEEICADYIRNKKSCGNGLDYDNHAYNDIFEACEAGGYADCSSLYDCIREINANWKVYDLNYCSLCGGASDDGIACM